jgi:hypothetical protein
MEAERTMQQMIQQLLARMEEMNTNMDAYQAAQARMETKLDASRKKMTAMFDAHHERIKSLSWIDGGHGFQGKPRGNGICNGASGGP